MQLSVEISLYPLSNNYIETIDDFLLSLNANAQDVEIRTSNMSTRLFGNYHAVTDLLNSAMLHSMHTYGKVVFVVKYLEGDARSLQGYS